MIITEQKIPFVGTGVVALTLKFRKIQKNVTILRPTGTTTLLLKDLQENVEVVPDH